MQWHDASSAGGFAATPSGWVSGLAVPIVCVLLGWWLVRLSQQSDRRQTAMETTLAEIGRAMAKNTESLAVVVSQLPGLDDRLTASESVTTDLRVSTARLDEALRAHERWTRERLRSSRVEPPG